MLVRCGCCQSQDDKAIIYSKKDCPAVNNVVYDTREEAVNCAVGDIELKHCGKCGFVFNSSYRSELVNYNDNYRNARSISPAYSRHLDDIVDISSRGIGGEKKILEIGCGDGEFLKRLCSKTSARGVGYDRAYHGAGRYDEKTSFVKEYFDPKLCAQKFDIVILRHVLEHIAEPYSFLKTICDAGILQSGGDIWIEVPDLEWILEKQAFYDVTYEHCNYFSKQSLGTLLPSLGFDVVGMKNVFGGQYILLEAIYSPEVIGKEKTTRSILSASSITNKLYETKNKYSELVEDSENICVWGASGKGVIFLSELSGELLGKVKYVIDIDTEKQGRFLPLCGKRISGPAVLKNESGGVSVLVMNGVYEREIADMLDELEIDAQMYVL